MKKIAKYLFLIPLLTATLSSCGGPEIDKETGLEVDKNENYVLEEGVSNENGSMSYEIFVRSFYDTNSDGIGDLNGVKAKIPYLADLGIKTIWLMPIHKSPTYHGYDVTDYYSVNPDYGTLNDFDALVAEANRYHIDIMLDMVFNHCSTQNAYFTQSFADYYNGNTSEDSKANWFNWDTTSHSGYNYYGKFNDVTYYYESRFDASMPDFNFDCKAVRDEIKNISKFWIKDHGVKGFRLDAVIYYYYNETAKNNAYLNELSTYVKSLNKDFYMVGEAWKNQPIILNYYDSQIDSLFAFNVALNGSVNPNVSITQMVKGYGRAENFCPGIEAYEEKIHEKNPNAYASYFLANHDTDRASSSLTGENAKVAASIYGLLPGTPFMYYGEEIELKGVRIENPNDMSDARRRLPMIWSKDDKTGQCAFPERNRKDLDNNAQVEDGADDCLKQNYSLINHYKKVINIRNKYPLFKHGIFKSMVEELGIEDRYTLAYKISLGNDSITIITNCGDTVTSVNVGELKISDTINTRQLIPSLNNGVLKVAPKSTVVLK